MTISIICVLLLYLSFSAPVLVNAAQAQQPELQDTIIEDAAEVREARPRVGRRQALALVQDSYSGRVLSIVLERGRWRVRMDDDGNVFNVFVDAGSGEVTRPTEQDDE